jgi:hypothetical protein
MYSTRFVGLGKYSYHVSLYIWKEGTGRKEQDLIILSTPLSGRVLLLLSLDY